MDWSDYCQCVKAASLVVSGWTHRLEVGRPSTGTQCVLGYLPHYGFSLSFSTAIYSFASIACSLDVPLNLSHLHPHDKCVRNFEGRFFGWVVWQEVR